MEPRGRDKEIGMPSSLGYNPHSNRESSSKLSSAPINSSMGERRRDHQPAHGNTIISPPPQTLDHHHPFYLHNQLNPQQQTHRLSRRDPDPSPDPGPTAAPIASTSASTPITAGSTLRSPAPQPQLPSLPPPPPAVSTPTTSSTSTIRYRECLKNHAASKGGHVVDGCGEFMPGGEEGTLEALKCAACECHRSFHRKEIDGISQYVASCYYTYNPNRNNSQTHTTSHPPQQLPHQHQHQRFSHAVSATPLTAHQIAPMVMAFGGGSGGGPAESSSEDLNMFQSNAEAQTSMQPRMSKKRFRTKFSQDQKDKMMEFADKLGWKIQKQDEQEVQQFCSQVGVRRQVFKVWMHNNKQAMKKKQI